MALSAVSRILPILSLHTRAPHVANAIATGSPVSWQRINLHGEFDFSDDAIKDSLRFDIEALLVLHWEQTTNPPV